MNQTIKTEPAISYETAINEYYGGVHGLSKSSIPFICKCGGKTYRLKEKDEDGIVIEKTLPVMHVEDTFKHIRTIHGERIKKYK